MLKALAELADANREFHYYLEHSYTPKSISELGVGSLKGQDRARVALLRVLNTALSPSQRFNFYLVHGELHIPYPGKLFHDRRHTLHDSEDETESEDEEDDLPTSIFTSLLSMQGTFLTSSPIYLDDGNVLNPDQKTQMQRWAGQHTAHHFLPPMDIKHEKYLLLAWPAKLAEDKMLALAGVKAHFTNMLSAGADPDDVRSFVQRVARMKATGQFKADQEQQFGQALYKHISLEPKLYDLFSVYIDIFPLGTHVPKTPVWSPFYDMSGIAPVANTTTPFIDVIEMTQQARNWETLEGKIVDAFAGKMLPILDFMEEVGKSKVLKTEMKDQLTKKLLGLFCHPNAPTTESDARNNATLQHKLWSAVLASEGSESFEDLARTYVAHFPQGGYAKPCLGVECAKAYLGGKQRFKDLLHLAKSASWDSISSTILKGFEGDMEGALVFVKLFMEQSLSRTIWAPFLDIAVKMCEATGPGDVRQATPNSRTATPKFHLLKAMWDVAMILDSKTEGSNSDSGVAAKLLTFYVTMAPTGIAGFAAAADLSDRSEDVEDLIQLARNFPEVWNASKVKVHTAMGSDMKRSLLFIKKCRLANLPHSVWGPIAERCTKRRSKPADAELSDEKLQTALWSVVIELPTSTLCRITVKRYLEASLEDATTACLALTTASQKDSRSFKNKRAVLQPLLSYWLHDAEKHMKALQEEYTEISNQISSGGTITGHPALAGFVKDARATRTIKGFACISDARICSVGIIFEKCSGSAIPGGRGEDSWVKVTKTDKYAQNLKKMRTKVKARRSEIKAVHHALLQLLSASNPDEGRPVKKQKLGQ